MVHREPGDMDPYSGGARLRRRALGADGRPRGRGRTAAAAAAACETGHRAGRRGSGMYLAHQSIDKSIGRTSSGSVLGAAVTGLAGVLYNYWLFGNAVGGAPFRTAYWMKELGTTSMFSGSLPVGLAGLTVSPGRGILIFSPIMVRRRRRRAQGVEGRAADPTTSLTGSAQPMPSAFCATRASLRWQSF